MLKALIDLAIFLGLVLLLGLVCAVLIIFVRFCILLAYDQLHFQFNHYYDFFIS